MDPYSTEGAAVTPASVILPAYNRAASLRQCLEALSRSAFQAPSLLPLEKQLEAGIYEPAPG
jgi:hypothetical protein